MDLVLHDSALGGFWRIWEMVRGVNSVKLLADKGRLHCLCGYWKCLWKGSLCWGLTFCLEAILGGVT